MSALLSDVERLHVRLDATAPRTLAQRGDPVDGSTVLTATYRTQGQAHAASLAFGGRVPTFPGPTRYVAFPVPGVRIEFVVDEAEPRHRRPGRPAMGARSRWALSGRHARREAAA